jgi:Flp pilus assembly protein TadG
VKRGRQRIVDGRRGALTVELLIILPILMLLIFGTIQLSLAISTRQTMAAACREGARLAAVGTSPTDVQQIVRAALGPTLSGNATIDVGFGQIAGPSGLSQDVAVVRIVVSTNTSTGTPLAFNQTGITVQSIMRKE